MRTNRSNRLLLAAALAFAAATPAWGASLLKPVDVPKSSRAPEMLRSPHAVAVDRAAIVAAGVGGTLDVALPNGKAVTVRIERLQLHDNGDLSWTGTVDDPERRDLTAVGTTGDHGTYAEIQTRDGSWGIAPAGEGHDWLFDKSSTQSELPPPAREDDYLVPPAGEHAPRPKALCPAITGMPSGTVTVDVLAVLGPDFVSAHGGAAGAESRLNAIFTNLNAFNAASNIAITYRRVGTMTVNYPAASAANDDDSVALNAITQGTGPFANVRAIRNFYGADQVTFFRGPKSTTGNSISGIAWLNGDGDGNIQPFHADYMYAVAGDWTLPSYTLIAHEIGHNLGNAHDRPNAGGDAGSTAYAYGHFVCGAGASATCGQSGFNNTGTGFGTIMSYHRPTVGKFSSPALMCTGPQAGALTAPCGVANLQDDVRATNCVRQTVASFRNSWVGNCANPTADADRDGIPDCLEAGSGKSTSFKDNDIFANGMLFAAQQYRDFLAREADADGLNFWTTQLNSGAQSRGAMVEGYFNSAEFQAAIAPVTRLYFAYFLRIPDYGGLQHWIGQFKSGQSLAQISQAFAASDEFRLRYGSLGNSQFVTLVYNNVLGRAPDSAGLAHWTQQLQNGLSRGDMMVAFSESAEYLAASRNDVYVTMMYTAMLRREPDQAGFDHWVGYLDRGNSGLALINGFLGSAEYRQRFLP